MRSLLLVVLLALPAQAAAPSVPAESTFPVCRIMSGEVVGISDPRLRWGDCAIEPGVVIRVWVEELPEDETVVRKVRRLRVEVHSDCLGTKQEAMARSEAELLLVVAKLAEAGFARESMELVPMGCKRPLVYPETNKAARSQNRRVEVTVVEVDEATAAGTGAGLDGLGTSTPERAQ